MSKVQLTREQEERINEKLKELNAKYPEAFALLLILVASAAVFGKEDDNAHH